MLSFFFSHSLFLLSHPFPPLFPSPQSTTRRNHINASRAKNQSLLLNIIPSYVASYYLRKGANSQVCMYAHMYLCNWQVLGILHSVVFTVHALTSAICAPHNSPALLPSHQLHPPNLPLTIPTSLPLPHPPFPFLPCIGPILPGPQ